MSVQVVKWTKAIALRVVVWLVCGFLFALIPVMIVLVKLPKGQGLVDLAKKGDPLLFCAVIAAGCFGDLLYDLATKSRLPALKACLALAALLVLAGSIVMFAILNDLTRTQIYLWSRVIFWTTLGVGTLTVAMSVDI